jgi:lysophospholipase L1-like esterase
MRSLVETLEGRRLMAAVPFTPEVAVPITVNRRGVVSVQGTSADDTVYVTVGDEQTNVSIQSSRPSRPEDKSILLDGQFVKRTLGNERKVRAAGGTLISPVSDRRAFPLGTVRSIVVNGAGGNDFVQLDTATQAFTFRRNIERTRLVIYNPKTRAHRLLDEVFVSPVPGQYGGRMAAWLRRSAEQIAGSAVAKKSAGVVFLGDSIVQRLRQTGAASYAAAFGGLRPLNLGLTGDTTSQVLYRIRHQGLIDGIRAKVVVLCVGTNNITLSNNPDATAAGVAAVVSEIRARLPGAKIVLSSVLPRPDPFDNRVVNKVNDRLARLADGNTVRFVNASPSFTSPRAKAKYFIPGDIHLTTRGYGVWTDLLEPAVLSALD